MGLVAIPRAGMVHLDPRQQKLRSSQAPGLGGLWPAARCAAPRHGKGKHFPEFVPLSGGAPFALVQMVATGDAVSVTQVAPDCWLLAVLRVETLRGRGGTVAASRRVIPGRRCMECGSAWRWRQAARQGAVPAGAGAGRRQEDGMWRAAPGPAAEARKRACAGCSVRAAARDTCTDLLYNRRPFLALPSGRAGRPVLQATGYYSSRFSIRPPVLRPDY